MRTSTTTTLVAGVPGMPSFSSRATLRSRMIQVLIAIQPVAITIWKKEGKYAPVRTACEDHLRHPGPLAHQHERAEDQHPDNVPEREDEHSVPEPQAEHDS